MPRHTGTSRRSRRRSSPAGGSARRGRARRLPDGTVPGRHAHLRPAGGARAAPARRGGGDVLDLAERRRRPSLGGRQGGVAAHRRAAPALAGASAARTSAGPRARAGRVRRHALARARPVVGRASPACARPHLVRRGDRALGRVPQAWAAARPRPPRRDRAHGRAARGGVRQRRPARTGVLVLEPDRARLEGVLRRPARAARGARGQRELPRLYQRLHAQPGDGVRAGGAVGQARRRPLRCRHRRFRSACEEAGRNTADPHDRARRSDEGQGRAPARARAARRRWSAP